jgi:uncharacterized phage protein (TIGR01671 family)
MREIKFRALAGKVSTSHVEWVYYGITTKPDLVGLIYITHDLQYTGLKDKNGKEIYDSDRVSRRLHLTEGNEYMDVTYDVKWNGWCFALFIADKQMHGLDPINARELEIVGNIYENPELLTP